MPDRPWSEYPAAMLGVQSRSWPDGNPIHGHNVFVKLACGHHRVSEGWRGSAGEALRCDACQAVTTIMATIVTEEEPYDWRTPEEGKPGEREEEQDVGERD